jgi:uncharacterized phage infection (PIP) family protein YhgE
MKHILLVLTFVLCGCRSAEEMFQQPVEAINKLSAELKNLQSLEEVLRTLNDNLKGLKSSLDAVDVDLQALNKSVNTLKERLE